MDSRFQQTQNTTQPEKASFPDGSPPVVCKGLTFLPIPEFDNASCAFGADERSFFNRRDLPKVPRKFEDEVDRLFFSGGEWPAFGKGVDQAKARRAIRAWLGSFAPAHEAKVATVAYALWVWSPEVAAARMGVRS